MLLTEVVTQNYYYITHACSTTLLPADIPHTDPKADGGSGPDIHNQALKHTYISDPLSSKTC